MGDYDEINERNAERARAAGWPELIGTPRQVPWATTVRQNRIDEFDAAQIPEAQRSQMREVLLREKQAAMWINNPWAAVWVTNLTPDELEATQNRSQP
ncbi:hypothetical protein [Nocardia sp. NPDC004722]